MSWNVYTDRTPCARKQHHCESCNNPIEIGTVYARRDGIWEGDAAAFIQHVECLEAEQFINDLYGNRHDDDWWPMPEWGDDDWAVIWGRVFDPVAPEKQVAS